jgi:fatty-acyl-CoA synthase
MYVGDWLGRRALLTPRKTALVDAATGARYSYAGLNARANRAAHLLRHQLGIAAGDRVAILAPNRIEQLDLIFACGKLGAIAVPLNWRLTPPELAAILHDCTPRALAYAPEYAAVAAGLCAGPERPRLLALGVAAGADVALAAAYEAPGEAPAVESPVEPEDPALILYTSGTTGRPKGAVLSHRMLVWNSINTIVGWELSAQDVTITHTPLFHTGGLNVLTLPLIHCGGTVVLAERFDPARCLELIAAERVTVLFAVPTMFQMMLDAPGFARADLSSVRFFISGGAPCPAALIRAYQARGAPFRQGYGLTEVGPNCFTLQPEDAIRKAGSVGVPNMHLDARIVDDAGRDLPPGAVGELILRGPVVCSGYWNNPDATAAALRDGWFYTGDLVRRDPDGYYFVVDRKKEMFISGGENIYPAEVENVLSAHPAVAEVAVIGVPDPTWGEVGRAVVVLRPGQQATAAELLAFCREQLARYKIPKSVVFAGELPHHATGKIARQEVRARYGGP